MTSELREKAELAVRKYRDEIEMHDGLSNFKTAVHFAAEMLREREDKEKAIELLKKTGRMANARMIACTVEPQTEQAIKACKFANAIQDEIEAFLAARAITDPKEPDHD